MGKVRRLPRWSQFLVFASLCTLTACGTPLDTKKIADAIKLDITTQGAPTLKTVTCPQKVTAEQGKPFKCVGELESGTRFAITVTQEDGKGTVKWDVPHTKGLLNLTKLEVAIKQALKSQFGDLPELDCGGKKYRSVKPGETFDCKIATEPGDVKADDKKADDKKADAKAGDKKDAKGKDAKGKEPTQPQRPVRVTIAIDPDRNVTWQQVLPEIKVASAPGKPGSATPASTNAATSNTTSTDAAADADAEAKDGQKKSKPLPPPTAEEIEELGLDRLD